MNRTLLVWLRRTPALMPPLTRLLRLGICLWVFCVSVAQAADLQPLDAFLEAAKTRNDSNLQAKAQMHSAQEQLKAATGRLLPRLSASGTYTRNQYHAGFMVPNSSGGTDTLTFMPSHQFDGAVSLTVPILDLTNIARRTVAIKTSKATTAGYAAAQQATDKQVAQAYYGLVGQQRVLGASQRSLDVTSRAEAITRDRREAGVASPLELERAAADTARAKQSLAEAQLQVALAERGLESLTWLAPGGDGALIVDDLHQEQSLAYWLGDTRIDALPPVASAQARAQASLAALSAAKLGYMPTLLARAQEKFTNLTGLNGGHTAVWAVSATLEWQLDFALSPQRRAQMAQVEADMSAQHQARRQSEDNIFADWHRIQAGIDKCRAARQESRASALAASISLEQYAVGADTQLDVLQATKEAFNADVKSIQADSDLIYQRALLRIDAGRPLVAQEIEP